MAALKSLRRLTSELRHALGSDVKLRDTRITQHILNQFRKHQVTGRQNCKAAQEMTYLADSYATYLQSQRKWKEIHEEYHKQELSVQQTADKVGFKLPHDPK